MTQIHLPEPIDEQAFVDGLTELLRIAKRHDISAERAWKCCVDSDNGWEVEIVPLETQ
ncbi:hypothetical protein [Halorubrum sp. CSM-61]|uniref:hypothetical protein n=1 Tax=Halorubrum sp. CSM-61 TaxID=2485838 RepID=UPI0013DE0348|nr:hypothetical protein [Halorubrum sp. CSM-61]